MPKAIVRSEMHSLQATQAQRADMARTIALYRRVVRLCCTIAMAHWPELGSLRSKEAQMALEALIHPTKDRPVVRYPVMARVLGKMPSYLRRAALSHALGAVSSFQSNWRNWLDGEIGGKARAIGSRSPRLGLSGVYPSLYGGNMILYGASLRTAQIKLLGADGEWRFSEPLNVKGKFKRLSGKMELCPSLILRGAKAALSCPVEVKPPKYRKNIDVRRVCAIDVGINTAATCAVVDRNGTVMSRTFLTCGRRNDQRDQLAQQIAHKQGLSTAGSDRKPARGFCRGLHRRIAGLSLDAAQTLASEAIAFAVHHRVEALVVEDLKGWRPKGPSRAQRKRFHRFQHRMFVQCLHQLAQEHGLRVLEVYPRGTSRWAYDGSGKVQRSKENAQLATFASGKRYNADLNGAYNIAARGLAMVLGLGNPRDKQKAAVGKSPDAVARMPLVLADIWAQARASVASTNNQRAIACEAV